MKTRVAWKMWKNDDSSPRFPKAMRTIETRTRRYYRNQAKKARKEGNIMMYKFCTHKAAWPYLMEDILFKEEDIDARAGKGYHIW